MKRDDLIDLLKRMEPHDDVKVQCGGEWVDVVEVKRGNVARPCINIVLEEPVITRSEALNSGYWDGE